MRVGCADAYGEGVGPNRKTLLEGTERLLVRACLWEGGPAKVMPACVPRGRQASDAVEEIERRLGVPLTERGDRGEQRDIDLGRQGEIHIELVSPRRLDEHLEDRVSGIA